MPVSRISILLMALLAGGQLCLAQFDRPEANETETEAAPPRKQYQVEAIAFRYLGPDSSGDEEFARLFVEDYFPPEPFDIEEYHRVRENVSYTEIVHLSDALERLRLAPQYSVMVHTAWVQPLLGKDEAIDVPLGYAARSTTSSLHSGSPEPVSPRMSGSLRVYGDYLLFVDLELKASLPRRAGAQSDEEAQATSFTSIIGGTGAAGTEAADAFEVFRISEKRRIKLEEFHYFDHPYIGAIVSVTRYEQPDDNAAIQ